MPPDTTDGTTPTPKVDFRAFLKLQLEVFDEVHSEEAIPLQERPLRSAFWFVEHCIVAIEGGTKEGFQETSWFKHLFGDVLSWYRERYGEAFEARSDQAKTVVAIRGLPFLVEFPLTRTTQAEEPRHIWLNIPMEFQDDEDALSMISQCPPLVEGEEEAISGTVAQRVTLIRNLSNNLLTATHPTQAARGLAASIRGHLDAVAASIQGGTDERWNNALWELHLTLEKMLKIVVHHTGARPANTHDLLALHRAAQAMPDYSLTEAEIQRLPASSDAIKSRYSEKPPPSLAAVFEVYDSILDLLSRCSESLTHKFRFENVGFLIKDPTL